MSAMHADKFEGDIKHVDPDPPGQLSSMKHRMASTPITSSGAQNPSSGYGIIFPPPHLSSQVCQKKSRFDQRDNMNYRQQLCGREALDAYNRVVRAWFAFSFVLVVVVICFANRTTSTATLTIGRGNARSASEFLLVHLLSFFAFHFLHDNNLPVDTILFEVGQRYVVCLSGAHGGSTVIARICRRIHPQHNNTVFRRPCASLVLDKGLCAPTDERI